MNYNTSYNFRVFVHVVRPSSGTVSGYIKENVASTAIENLNDYYAEANITFSLLGSDYIDDDKYINMTLVQCTNEENLGYGLFEENVQTNAINIYVLSSAPNLKTTEVELNGLANDIPGNACLVKELNYTDATLAHEIGHCLGLYHTHHGVPVERILRGSPHEPTYESCRLFNTGRRHTRRGRDDGAQL